MVRGGVLLSGFLVVMVIFFGERFGLGLILRVRSFVYSFSGRGTGFFICCFFGGLRFRGRGIRIRLFRVYFEFRR